MDYDQATKDDHEKDHHHGNPRRHNGAVNEPGSTQAGCETTEHETHETEASQTGQTIEEQRSYARKSPRHRGWIEYAMGSPAPKPASFEPNEETIGLLGPKHVGPAIVILGQGEEQTQVIGLLDDELHVEFSGKCVLRTDPDSLAGSERTIGGKPQPFVGLQVRLLGSSGKGQTKARDPLPRTRRLGVLVEKKTDLSREEPSRRQAA
jgi:hypothetical protein